MVTIAGSQAALGANLDRTMLAITPEFSRYELVVSPDPVPVPENSKSYFSNTGSFQLTLPPATYFISAIGYTGDKPSARTWDSTKKTIETREVTVSADAQTVESLTLRPYMEDDIYGTLQYSINWDAVGQIPTQAELLIEHYNDNGTPDNFNDDTWDPISISLITGDASAGSRHGTVVLLRKATGLVKQTGSLQLPPGEYRLTATVTMDSPWPPVSRTDIAHIYSNLITPAAFFYTAGDLTVTNPGLDTGAGFITKFNFSETPGAVSVVGSAPGPDGTRLIMVMVPSGTDLTHLTPVVECASGARVTSPAPHLGSDGSSSWDTGDYSKPTSWTAEGWNGVTQQYTVVVTSPADDECLITHIAFVETGLTQLPAIIQSSGEIRVIVPNGTGTKYPNYNLTPVISWIGKEIKLIGTGGVTETAWTGEKVVFGSPPSRQFKVYAKDSTSKTYTVTITEAASGDAEITAFVFDGYPGYAGVVTQPSGSSSGTIKVELPYGTPLGSLRPLVTYKGNLSPASGLEQNFSAPVNYTVISPDGLLTKTYTVTVTTTKPNLGIFDFVVTNVPRAKVVIGTKPRADGKIPIIVSVPYKTSPLISDNSKTDLKALIPKITLADADNTISPSADGTSDVIPFNNQNDYQEAVYTVSTTGSSQVSQQYVVIAARDIQHYYVSASGDDEDPDYYNGSEQAPFKTLAHAVYQSVKHNVDHIYVIGTLNDTSEGGAYEDTSTTNAGGTGTFNDNGGESTSVFNIKGTGLDGSTPRHIYITGVGSNAVLQGTSGKRVISVTGGAHITFENIAIQGGGSSAYAGKGGGIYVGENSKIVWKNGVISGNTAASGGGVYVDNSQFSLMTGSVRNNTATSGAVTRAQFENNAIAADSIAGGGGVYVYGGDSWFWLAEGDISGNTTKGSGGGVLVNGSTIPTKPTADTTPHDFVMSAGTISGNVSGGDLWPHGGGGVYVAKGVFEMLDGHITGNQSTRQGGGVFVWSRSLFNMGGNSSVTGNIGVGSSRAICNRGITTMRGRAQADSVYVWNYAKGAWNNGFGDEFTLMDGARVSGLVLAFADDPKNNRNYINIVEQNGQFFTPGTDPITTIDLESHLTSSGSFAKDAIIDDDWLGKYLIKNGGNEIPAAQAAALIKRFPLGTFTSGGPSKSLSGHKLDNTGKLVK